MVQNNMSNNGGNGTTGSTGTSGSAGTSGSTGTMGSTGSGTGSGLNTGTTGTSHSTGTTGTSSFESGSTYAGGSSTADTMRPTGGTTTVQPLHAETRSFDEARSSYQPSTTAVTVTQRRSASRPSRNMVIGSVLAGAVAGGAIPFMLSGRKSGQTRSAEVHHDRGGYAQSRSTEVHQDRGGSTQGQTTGTHQSRGASAVHTDTGPITDASTTRRS